MISGLAMKAQEKTFSLNSSNKAVHWKIKAVAETGQGSLLSMRRTIMIIIG